MKKKFGFVLLSFAAILYTFSSASALTTYKFADWKAQEQVGGTEIPQTSKFYDNGEVVYLDVKTGEECTNYHPDNSKTGYNGMNPEGNQTSCLKFYAFNDTAESKIVKLLLDHNTTATINWSSKSTSEAGPDVIIDQLATDTDGWSDKFLSPADYSLDQTGKTSNAKYTIDYPARARLISVQEIAQAVGITDFNEVTAISDDYFSFGSSNANGWIHNTTSTNCMSNGCWNNGDVDIDGYWTSTAVSDQESRAWSVYNDGSLDYATIHYTQYNGIRPVIEILKSRLGLNFGTATKVDDVVTALKGETIPVDGKYVGPFSNSSTATLEDGIDEKINIELDPTNISAEEKFQVSLTLKNSDNEYVSEAIVNTEKVETGIKVTLPWDTDFEALVNKFGIYTYNWLITSNEGKTYLQFSLIQGDEEIAKSAKIDMDAIENDKAITPIAEEDGVSVSYLWFNNIDLENGVNVYSELPKVALTLLNSINSNEIKINVFKYKAISADDLEYYNDYLTTAGEELGYTFDGFFSDSEMKNEFDTSTVFVKDETIYAKFTKIEEPEEEEPEEEDPEEKDPEEKDPEEKDPEEKDPEEKDPEEKDPEEKDPEEKDPEEKDPEEKDPEEKDPEEKDPEEKDPEEKDPEEKDPEEKDPEEENPKTGDNIKIYIGIGMISIIGLAGAAIYINKKNELKNK